MNVGSSLNNLEVEAENVEIAINFEALEFRIAIFISTIWSPEVQLTIELDSW
jgi:hypothetical protein